MYLEVKFHDNDFYNEFIDALRTLWNAYPNPALLKEVHDEGKLVSIIKRLIVAEYLKTSALMPLSRMGRMLNKLNKGTGGYKLVGTVETAKKYTEYFDIKLEFHETDEFTKTWCNSEHFCLNLDTGEVKAF